MSGALTVSIDTAAPDLTVHSVTVNEGDLATLTGSFDDGIGYGPYTQTWHLVSGSNGQDVSDATGDSISFTPADDGAWTFSYTVTDAAGVQTEKQITVGINDGNDVEVLSGLDEGEMVISHKNDLDSKWKGGQNQGQNRPMNPGRIMGGGR